MAGGGHCKASWNAVIGYSAPFAPSTAPAGAGTVAAVPDMPVLFRMSNPNPTRNGGCGIAGLRMTRPWRLKLHASGATTDTYGTRANHRENSRRYRTFEPLIRHRHCQHKKCQILCSRCGWKPPFSFSCHRCHLVSLRQQLSHCPML